MNRTEAGIKLISTFAMLGFGRKAQLQAIREALAYEKPIAEMDKHEIETVLKSIMGE